MVARGAGYLYRLLFYSQSSDFIASSEAMAQLFETSSVTNTPMSGVPSVHPQYIAIRGECCQTSGQTVRMRRLGQTCRTAYIFGVTIQAALAANKFLVVCMPV